MNLLKSTQGDANDIGQKAKMWAQKQQNQGEHGEVASSYASRCNARDSEAEAERVNTNVHHLSDYVCKSPWT
jgi:hypothetical protein